MSVSNEFGQALVDEVNHLKGTLDRVVDERDTLIACLRECVVALEEVRSSSHRGMVITMNRLDGALFPAKSTLSKYER